MNCENELLSEFKNAKRSQGFDAPICEWLTK